MLTYSIFEKQVDGCAGARCQIGGRKLSPKVIPSHFSKLKKTTCNVALGVLLWTGASAVMGQEAYPTRPIRLVTAEAGGSGDIFLRGLAQALTTSLGQSAFVENRPGSAAIPSEVVARSAPDGYTLLFYTMNVWITPLLQKAAYDPVKDLAPITLATKASSVLVVSAGSSIKSVKDLITLSKSKPGEVVYAQGSDASISSLTTAMFRSMTGVQVLSVPYKGVAQALADVAAGRAQVMFPNAAAIAPLVKAGKLRAIAVSTPERSSLFPELPTVAETVPGFASSTTSGLFAPAKTPEAIIMRLNQEVNRYVRLPDTKQKLANTGAEAAGSTPQEFAKYIQEDMTRWAKVIKDTNLHVNDE